jgi:hypothetical protein
LFRISSTISSSSNRDLGLGGCVDQMEFKQARGGARHQWELLYLPIGAEAEVGLGAFMDAGRVRRLHHRCICWCDVTHAQAMGWVNTRHMNLVWLRIQNKKNLVWLRSIVCSGTHKLSCVDGPQMGRAPINWALAHPCPWAKIFFFPMYCKSQSINSPIFGVALTCVFIPVKSFWTCLTLIKFKIQISKHCETPWLIMKPNKHVYLVFHQYILWFKIKVNWKLFLQLSWTKFKTRWNIFFQENRFARFHFFKVTICFKRLIFKYC